MQRIKKQFQSKGLGEEFNKLEEFFKMKESKKKVKRNKKDLSRIEGKNDKAKEEESKKE